MKMSFRSSADFEIDFKLLKPSILIFRTDGSILNAITITSDIFFLMMIDPYIDCERLPKHSVSSPFSKYPDSRWRLSWPWGQMGRPHLDIMNIHHNWSPLKEGSKKKIYI